MGTIKNINDFLKAKKEANKISVITAYDYSSAKLISNSNIDCILVGDSLATVIQGHSSTIPVTLEQMIYHASLVKRGSGKKFVIADLPFGSYQGNEDEAVINAGRFLKECNVQAVKLEGAGRFAKLISRMVDSSIPIMGHLGLTPQSIHTIGAYKVQGRSEEEKDKLIQDAIALEKAGCFAIVLELVMAETAKEISQSVSIPTIGIGSGIDTDGQVLVYHDVLGLLEDFSPTFVKKFTAGASQFTNAFNDFDKEIKSKLFPAREHSFYNKD